MNLCLLLPINKLPCDRKVLVIVLCNHMRLHIDLNQNFMSIHCSLTCQHSSWSCVFYIWPLGGPTENIARKTAKETEGWRWAEAREGAFTNCESWNVGFGLISSQYGASALWVDIQGFCLSVFCFSLYLQSFTVHCHWLLYFVAYQQSCDLHEYLITYLFL